MEELLYMNCWLKVNHEIYGCSYVHNGLYHLDLEREEIRYITHFEGESINQKYMFCGVVHTEHIAIFCPYLANDFHIMNSDDWSEVKSICFRRQDDMKKTFHFAGVWCEKAYIFREDLKVLYAIDIHSYEVTRKVIRDRQQIGKNLFPFYSCGQIKIEDGKSYIVLGRKCGDILGIDLCKAEIFVAKELGEKGLEAILLYDKVLYLVPTHADYILGIADGNVEKYSLGVTLNSVASRFRVGDIWYIVDDVSKVIVQFDLHDKTITYDNLLDSTATLDWCYDDVGKCEEESAFGLVLGDNCSAFYVDKYISKKFELSVHMEKRMEYAMTANCIVKEDGVSFDLKNFVDVMARKHVSLNK